MAVAIVLVLYGLASLIGGVVGFKKARSMPSLIAGTISGLLLIVAGSMAQGGMMSGAYMGFGVNLLLIIVFAMRYAKTKKVMPAGFMLGVSVVVAGILVTQLFQ